MVLTSSWNSVKDSTCSVSFYLVSAPSISSVTSDLRSPSPLACAVGCAAAFAVNAALVASQWRHRAWTFLRTHPSTTRPRPFSSLWPGRESNLIHQFWWRRRLDARCTSYNQFCFSLCLFLCCCAFWKFEVTRENCTNQASRCCAIVLI